MDEIDLSVVIPSVNGWEGLRACLEALAAQPAAVRLEVLVADRVGETVRIPLRESFPEVRTLEAEPEASIPALRSRAFGECRGKIVGVIEDHVIVPPSWAAEMLEAHREGARVVGGSVKNSATDRLTDWAAFLCEYSHCLDVPASESADWVMGNNVTYDGDLLERFRPVIEEERWENHLHDAMREAGVALVTRPDIRVGHDMHYTVGEYLEQRYLYARSYAGMRVAGAGGIGRFAYGVAGAALPPLLFGRTVLRVWKSGRHRRELLRSIPLLALFVTAWGVGEMVGAWFGAGDALARIR